MQRNKVFEDPLECYLSRLEVRFHDFTRSYGLLDCTSFSWEKNLRRSIFHYSIRNSDLFFAFKYTPHLAVFFGNIYISEKYYTISTEKYQMWGSLCIKVSCNSAIIRHTKSKLLMTPCHLKPTPPQPPILVSKDEQISRLVPTVVKLQTCTSGCCSNRAAQFEFILGAVRLVWCHLFTIF